MSGEDPLEDFPEEKIQAMLATRIKLKDYVLQNSRQGDVQHVIDTIDKFGWNEQWLMNIGDRKGTILDQAIRTKQPKSVLELGTFLGYSSLRIVSLLPADALFVTIEADPQSADVARAIHTHAGVTGRIEVVCDDSAKVIPRLKKDFHVDSFDLIFIDHWKDVYLRDLKLLEDAGLIKSGTVIVADNVITPGAPDYLEYVRNNPNYTNKHYEAMLEYDDTKKDGIEISIRK